MMAMISTIIIYTAQLELNGLNAAAIIGDQNNNNMLRVARGGRGINTILARMNGAATGAR